MRVESRTAPKPDPVDWGLEQDIRRIERESASQASETIETKMGRDFRIDLPQLPAEPLLPQTSATSEHLATRVRLPRKSRRTLWPLATFGLILFGVGTSLLAASTFGDFPLLWDWGMPLTLAGQAGVLLGVVLYLDRIGRTGQTAVERLEQVDDHIQGLEDTTRMLSTTHSTPSQAFYSHFAAGADPKILLTDVKGQLDLLAQRMSQQ